jgi:hypothetical protein
MRLTSRALPHVMVVTLPRDVGYGNASLLSAYFAFIGRCSMRKDERDVSEILKFELFEETVGNWLRSIIKRLEEEGMAIQTQSLVDSHVFQQPSGKSSSH